MKKGLLLLTVFVYMLSAKAFSQETFSKKIKFPGYGSASRTIVASNGDLLALIEASDSGIYIFRVSSAGKLKWEKIYEPNSVYIYRTTFCATKDNGFAIFSDIYYPTKSHQMPLIKCDSLGNIEWSRSMDAGNSNNNFYAGTMYTDARQDIIITYTARSKIFPYPEGIQLLRFNKSGNLIFQTGFKDVPQRDYGSIILNSVIETFDEGYLIGFSYTEDETNVRRGYFILTDKNGDLVSYKQFGPPHFNFDDADYQIDVFKHDNKYYMLGYYFYYTGDDDGKNYYYITSFKKNGLKTKGRFIAYNAFALQKFVRENNITRRQLDKYVIDKNGIRFLNLETYDNENSVFSFNKYDSLGRVCPDYTLPVFDYDTSTIDVEASKEIRGAIKSLDTIAITNNAVSQKDIQYMKKICSGDMPTLPVTNKSNSTTASTVLATVFPNPSHNIITISLTSFKNKQTQFGLYNSSGKMLQSFYVYDHQATLNIASYPKGIYLIRISDKDQTQTLKFIKNNDTLGNFRLRPHSTQICI